MRLPGFPSSHSFAATLPSVVAAVLTLLRPSVSAAPGDVDLTFDPNANGSGTPVAVQPDGKIVFGGNFTTVGGVPRNRIARLNADGSLDTAFGDPNAANIVSCLTVQPDGKILAGGQFDMMGGVSRLKIARLNANGTLDTAFNPAADNFVLSTRVLADGKILVGGLFTFIAAFPAQRIARLNATGTFDESFGTTVNGDIFTTCVQTDGKILIGGGFTSAGGSARNGLARLEANSSLDPNFQASAGVNVLTMAQQTDGKVIVGGSYTDRLKRVEANGNPDNSFFAGPNGRVTSVALQADGKFIVGGDFTMIANVARNRIARFNPDGTLDMAFDPNAGGGVTSLALQADGKILVTGSFGSMDGAARNNIARLENNAATQSLTVASNRVQWLRGGASPETHQVSFELSTNGGTSYTALGAGTRITGGWERTGLSLPATGQIRARAVTSGGIYGGSSGLVETVMAFTLAPEIAVSGNSAAIVDGDTTPSLTDHTDFDSTPTAGGLVVRTFTIANTGTASLTVGGVTVGGTNAADFSVTAAPGASVVPGGNTTFQVTFNPGANGLRNATLSFSNNDANENPYNFSIRGTGLAGAPEIAVTGNGAGIVSGDFTPAAADHTDFGTTVTTAGTTVRTFTIANSGNASLVLGTVTVGGGNAADFTVTSQPAASVGAGLSTSFQVTFDPVAYGLRSATLSFINDDADENPFTFGIQGTALTTQEAWRQQYFGTTANAGNAADQFDFEFDGFVNGVEFAFGLNPTLFESAANLPSWQIDAQGRLAVEFIRRKAATQPGISYLVETGDALANLAPLDLSGATVVSLDATFERVTVTDPAVTVRRFGRVHIVDSLYTNDFNAGPGAATVRGTALWTNQMVRLTNTAPDELGAVVFDDITASPALDGFTARFQIALGPTTTGVPADGFSFAAGDLGAVAWGESGPGTAGSLAVGFDTYANAGTGSIGIHVWVNGTHLTANATNPYTNGAFVPVEISYDPATGLTVKYNGATIFTNLATPGFAFPAGSRFGIGARTGGANEQALVDDVEITLR